jgi:hypothetical protein
MPRFPVSPYWSSNPNIPIYLDHGDDCNRLEEHERPSERTVSESPHSRHAPEYICPTCETSSRDTPIHCVSVSPSPAPPSYNSIAPQAPSARHLTVPTLTVETPRHWSRPQAPSRTLQIDQEARPHVRFRSNAFSPVSPPNTEFGELGWDRKSQVGLGIRDALFNPDASPLTPGTIEKHDEQTSESIESHLNIAQRIERKLYNYTASRSVVKRWLLEIISWSLSAACMGGIVLILALYKDKRIPKWPLGLTLNACISVLSKIASAALLLPVSEALGQLKWSWFQGGNSKKMWDFEIFDNASRGPWGSLLLLVRTKGKSLAALGAAVTLFALALDPFFQQVVEYPEHWRIQDGHGSIPRAVAYRPFSFGAEYQVGMEAVNPDQSMLGVVSRFFYNNGTPPMTFGRGVRAEVPLGCPNSNCTWPEYETLGIHSECTDASDRLEFGCHKGQLDWVQVPDMDPKGLESSTYPNGTACGWWLKSDPPLLMTGYNVDRDSAHSGEIMVMRAQPLYDVFSKQIISGYQTKLNNSRDPLTHAVIVSNVNSENVRLNATPIAHECIISWVAKTILSNYSEGGYSEIITKVIVNSTVDGSPWITVPTYGVNNRVEGWDYTYKESIMISGRNGNVYGIDNRTHVLTGLLFDDIFPSQFTLINTTDDADGLLRYKQYKNLVPYTRNLTYNPWLYPNITEHLESMTVAMTNLMRSGAQDTEWVEGATFDLESFVDVRWPWLTLPLGLLFSTAVLLLLTIIRSSREKDHVGVWKTSAIATLLHGPSDDMARKMTSSKVEGTPRAKAKEVKVKWKAKGGWRFSGNSISPTSFRASHAPSHAASTPKDKQSPPVDGHWI